MALKGANSAVDARVALDGHKIARGCVHEIQGQLPSEIHRLAQAAAQLDCCIIVLTSGLLVHQTRCGRLEEFEAGEDTIVEECKAAIFWCHKQLLDDVGHVLACVAGAEVVQLLVRIRDWQKQNLRARFRIVNGWLDNELLSILCRTRLFSLAEEFHSILSALHCGCEGACKPSLHECLVECVLVVECVTRSTIKCKDADVRREIVSQMSVS
mmetsp:Transcript_10561/g.19457  ORF Transcript_10561/g.19457 Transcript_10561/m.19457 type:complete len:212 (-) Transcript_10561:572-1207(-)